MCDKIEFEKLKDRMMSLEKSQLVQGEQIKTLFHSAQLLYRVVLVGGLLLLLTVIYGAIGGSGFNAVTHAATTISETATN